MPAATTARRGVRRQLHAYERTGVDPVLDPFDGLEARVDAAAMGREPVAPRLSPHQSGVKPGVVPPRPAPIRTRRAGSTSCEMDEWSRCSLAVEP